MANIDLKNLNLEDIKNQILKFADKKTLIRIGIGFGGLIFFLIIYSNSLQEHLDFLLQLSYFLSTHNFPNHQN